jgi:hypothetical protein
MNPSARVSILNPSLPVLTLAAGIWLTAQTPPGVVRGFDEDPPNAAPKGFVFAETREAAPSRWLVRREGSSHVLAHLVEPAPSGGFALAILEGSQFGSLRASVRLKIVQGQLLAGLVWRYHNPDNYHVAWLNLSEQRAGIYRFSGGNRVRLRSVDDLELDPTAWHTLKIEYENDRIEMHLGGIKVFDMRNRGADELGSVGVWSAGDAVAYFDDFRAEDAPRRRYESPRR